MTGWNLPPGCTNADIDRAYGGEDPSPESECVCELLDALTTESTGEAIDAVQVAVVKIVDELARSRAECRALLEAALCALPPDPPRPAYTCVTHVAAYSSYCELHDGGYDAPTLREEIAAYLAREQPK